MNFKTLATFVLVALGLFSPSFAQDERVQIKDFIVEHRGLDNIRGEIVPINIDEIKKKINFFIDEKYPDVVKFTDNIIWDAYHTFTSHSYRRHYHSFIARVIINELDEIRFIEVDYNPYSKTVSGPYKWSIYEEDFYVDPFYLERERRKPDLVALEIANQEQKPTLEDLTREHANYVQMIEEKNNGQNELVPLNINRINKMVKNFVRENFDNVEYTRNIIWNSYSTFISPYSKHHYHSFIAQVRVKGFRQRKYIEVFYNPLTEKISSDFVWDDENGKFYRPLNDLETK